MRLIGSKTRRPMIAITIEGLAAMLAAAYTEGHEAGHMLIPHPSHEDLFLEYQSQVECLCEKDVRH